MLRFDIAPVCANAYRLQALMTFLVSLAYLLTPHGWLAFVIVAGGLLRGFVSPHTCPSYRLFAALTAKLGLTRKVNAGAKMFADKIAATAAAVMALSWVFDWGIGHIPAIVLLVFSFIDLSTGFCAACWAYALWYKLRGAA